MHQYPVPLYWVLFLGALAAALPFTAIHWYQDQCRDEVLKVEDYGDRVMCSAHANALVVEIDNHHAVVHCVCSAGEPS